LFVLLLSCKVSLYILNIKPLGKSIKKAD
jgi:hypothetical protein